MLDLPNGGLEIRKILKGMKLVSLLTSSVGDSQLIDQRTHITKESSPCIDLIFTSNPNFISA